MDLPVCFQKTWEFLQILCVIFRKSAINSKLEALFNAATLVMQMLKVAQHLLQTELEADRRSTNTFLQDLPPHKLEDQIVLLNGLTRRLSQYLQLLLQITRYLKPQVSNKKDLHPEVVPQIQ